MEASAVSCRICGAETKRIGTVFGKLKQQDFYLYRCPACLFSFISNPCTEHDKIYSSDYYSGKGADPLADYVFELEHPEKTIRVYEWRGILNVIGSLKQIDSQTRWLDYGCGNGGLVRYVNQHAECRAVGFEEGWVKDMAASRGIPYIDRNDLEKQRGSFDIISAIEVLEHLENPIETLSTIKALLKPGGLFFYTTGNAEPVRDRLLGWNYIVPEVHISFFEPTTLDYALQKCGFKPEFKGFMPGYVDIIRFKILKNLRRKTRSVAERFLPWSAVSRVADMKYCVTAHPIAWA